MKSEVIKFEYDEKGGVLDVTYNNGAKYRYFLIEPKTYDKRFNFNDDTEFVRKCLVNRYPSRAI